MINVQTGFDYNDINFTLIDIEASYALGYFFPSKREQYIPASSIKYGQFYPCAAWRRLGGGKTKVIKTTDDKARFTADFRDDYIVAKTMHDVMSEADVIIAHNGDNFDMKHLNVAFRRHGLGAVPQHKTIDTLKAARKYFAFAGNSLADLLKEFGLPTKHEKPDWKLLTEGDEGETNKAAKYCKIDVDRLEQIFIEMRPFMRNLPKVKKKGRIEACDACGSKRVHDKRNAFDGTKLYRRIRCGDCGHEMRADIKFYLDK